MVLANSTYVLYVRMSGKNKLFCFVNSHFLVLYFLIYTSVTALCLMLKLLAKYLLTIVVLPSKTRPKYQRRAELLGFSGIMFSFLILFSVLFPHNASGNLYYL